VTEIAPDASCEVVAAGPLGRARFRLCRGAGIDVLSARNERRLQMYIGGGLLVLILIILLIIILL
jgi:hypothetical protein